MKVTAKDILAWIKGHIVIVASVLFILAILPVAFFLSSGWLKKIVTTQQESASQELTKIKGADITYNLTQVDPTQPAVSEKNAPNAALIEYFKQANERIVASASAAAVKGTEFNQGKGPLAASVGRSEFKPLVEGLFPKPALSEAQSKSPNASDILVEQEGIKLNEMEDALLGKRGRSNPYTQLLANVRAGGPMDSGRLEEILRDMRAREIEKITSNARQLTDEENARLRTQLQDRRLAELQANARRSSVYMTMETLVGSPASTPSAGPRTRRINTGTSAISQIVHERITPDELNRANMFMKQWDIWLLSDFFAAVRLANQGPDGAPLGIDKAVVKRIESIEIRMPDGIKPFESSKSEVDPELAGLTAAEPEAAPASDVPAGMVPLDKSKSITGRVRGGWNEVYEVRRLRATCIVSSAQLNDFLAAIARVNYMSVTDLDLGEVDAWAALDEGYFYGDEHVVRVTLEVESIWLKSWLVPMMPEELRKALGMKVEEAAPPM
jgi:hypothetical protein